MKNPASFALMFSVLLLSCRSEESATGPDVVSSRPVAARIAAGSVSSEIWTSTDSVRFKAVTTANDALLDTGFSLVGKSGVLHLKSVSVRSDLGVTLTAKGYQAGVLLWEGSATGAASEERQTLEMHLALADTVANTAPPLGTVNAPVIDSLRTLTGGVAAVTDDEPVRVFLSTLTDSATIVYTLDGSAPTVLSAVYRDTGLVIDGTCQLRAMAVRRRYTNSTLLVQGFVLQAQGVSAVSLSATAWADPDMFDQEVTVRLSSATPNAEIRYTLDGTIPTRSSELYTSSGVLVDSTRVLKAVVFAGKAMRSAEVLARSFVLQARPATVASLSPKVWAVPDTFDRPVTVALASMTPNAEIRYTLDGTIPTRSSELYTSSGVLVDSTRVLKAVVFAGKAARSAEVLTQVLQLRLKPVEYSLLSTMDWFRVYLTCPSPNAVIRYTKDGTIPTEQSSVYGDSLVFGAEDSVTIRMTAFSSTGKLLTSKVGTLRAGLSTSGEFEDGRDGQIYGSVQIGSRRWMTQNLNYKPPMKDSGWCFNGKALNCRTYGRLYTWDASMAGSVSSAFIPSGVRGICPDGWHIPSDLEWSSLLDIVEDRMGDGNAGCALKASTTWNASTGCAQGRGDLFGFHALPSGFRSFSGNYSAAGSYANWWTSTASASGSAWAYSMISTSSDVTRSDNNTSFGMAIRCVR